MEPLVEVRDMSVRLRTDGREATVVSGVSFEIDPGECLGLVGESGSGKSMTARSLIRLLPGESEQLGSIRIAGRDVLSLSKSELRGLRSTQVAMIFQDPRAHIDPLWRISDHIAEPLRLRGFSHSAARARSLELLDQVRIADPELCLDSYPSQLSGGMLQRVMIAGALAAEPELLIADEPTTALDVTTQAEIMGILADLERDRGLATLFITHDLELASSICDRVLVMYAGTIVESGTCADVFVRQYHPYTWGLLKARPRLDGPIGKLEVIPGRPVSGSEAPDGCPFAPRCRWAEPECEVLAPLLSVGEGRFSRCRRIEEIGNEFD